MLPNPTGFIPVVNQISGLRIALTSYSLNVPYIILP